MAPRFFGRDDRSLDGKGRVILPARYRPSFTTSVFITPHYERCLALWSVDEFNIKFEEMQALQHAGIAGRNFARMWSATSAEEKIDGQGRISIPQNLRDFARLQLESPVLVTGSVDRVELWNPSDWEERVGPAENLLAEGFPSSPLPAPVTGSATITMPAGA